MTYIESTTKCSQIDDCAKNNFTIIYPNEGSSDNLPTVVTNKRYVLNNPFKNSFVICEAQLLIDGIWACPKWIYSSASSGSYGVEASQLGDKIIIQTGTVSLKAYSYNSGDAFGIPKNFSEAPCRVLVKKIG